MEKRSLFLEEITIVLHPPASPMDGIAKKPHLPANSMDRISKEIHPRANPMHRRAKVMNDIAKEMDRIAYPALFPDSSNREKPILLR